ncbi:hypothetical protein Tsubulata_032114 [Turnera subulata]|uniref:F-box domain-containing protein n=1 Tax=Turnera subulata TaxID=218843 RepID=A0A9Q0J9B8_9ROSI|nr:hypothetical protein Tsubulata_032114 [Turnera subulata]
MANLTLPPVIVEEILAMLPSKSIHRFRQVSKSWSSFLVSVEFQKLRTNKSTVPPETNLQKILQCSTVDDGHVIESLGCLGDEEDPVRLQFPTDKYVHFLGSCNGLVCVAVGDNESGVEEIVVWNPFTGIYRKLHDIGDRRICACGFGYESEADDYKVFIATKPASSDGADDYKVKIFSFLKKKKKTKFEIFSLRTGSWKEVKTTGHGGKYVERIAEEHEVGLFLNGALHWEVRTGRKIKVIAFDLAREKFSVVVLVLPRDLVVELEFKALCVLEEYLAMSFFPKGINYVGVAVCVRKEQCDGVYSWVHFVEYVSVESVSRIYFKCDFIPQAVKEGGHMILHFSGGLKWDNPDEETNETGGVFLNIKFSEFRKTIAYTEALTSAYAPLEIKQLQV